MLEEWTIALLLGLVLCMFSGFFRTNHFPERPPQVLGRVDQFNDSDLVVAYTPVTNMTQKIMDKMALASFMKGLLSDDRCFIIMQPHMLNFKFVLQVEFIHPACGSVVLSWGKDPHSVSSAGLGAEL